MKTLPPIALKEAEQLHPVLSLFVVRSVFT